MGIVGKLKDFILNFISKHLWPPNPETMRWGIVWGGGGEV